jgi:NAD(P)-dependent dehydrogenase (short-subunit alcohol dehydrogenase family)
MSDNGLPTLGKYKSTGPVDCTGELDTSKIKGKTAIVTGGASGRSLYFCSSVTCVALILPCISVGEAYVRALSKAGAYVVVADLNEENAKKVAQDFPNTAVAVRCDVTKWEDQKAVFKKAIELSPDGQIDIVVANAGIGGGDPMLTNDISAEEPEEPKLLCLDVNVYGTILRSSVWDDS